MLAVEVLASSLTPNPFPVRYYRDIAFSSSFALSNTYKMEVIMKGIPKTMNQETLRVKPRRPKLLEHQI